MILLCLRAGTVNTSAIEVIGFSVASPKNSNQNFLYAGDYAGAPGARTNNWNNLLASADGSAADIAMADGSISNSAGNIVTGMSVLFHPASSGGGVYNRTGGGTNDPKMFADVSDTWNCSGFSQYGYIDITNIPYASYNIYCYFRPDNGNGSANTRGGFWVITNAPTGTNRLYIQNQSNDVAQTQEPVPSSTGGNYVQSTTTSIPSGGAAWSSIQGGNYAVFSNLTNSWTRVWFGGLGNGSGAKDDLGSYVSGGSTAVRFKVAGFQIVQVPTGVATSIYLQSTNLTLHAGNPAGTQATVLANLDTGATGVNVTTASGISYTVDNPNVATVNGTGLLTPGTNGTANLIVSYQSVSLTNPITVIGPTSLSVSVAKTNLLVGNGQGDATTATLLATFSDATNVTVNAFNFVSFSGSSGISVTSNGVITATGAGAFSVTGTYDGLSVTTNNVGVVTTFTAPGSVSALSVNITDSGAHGMAFHDLSGSPGARVGYWNNLVVPSAGNVTNQISGPVDYHGNALAGTVVQWIPNTPSGSYYAYTIGTLTTNESVMFGSIFDQGMNNGTSYNSQLVISNVPFASYDAYFYFYNDNSSNGTNRPGQVTIDGVTQYRINSMSYPTTPDNNGNGYVQAVQPASAPASVTQVPYGNFIKFSSITDGVLNVTWGAVGQDVFADAAIVTRARLAGFQLVKSLDGLTATNIYLPASVPNLLPGNPAVYSLTVLANFSDGEMGGNITALPGVNYASSDTNVFLVDTNGVITPGLMPGTATLTITYQTNTLNASVTTLAPTMVMVKASPGTVYLDGALGITTAQASLYASFPGHTNVNISSFASVSYVDQGSSAATMDSSGYITAYAQGQANLGASYLGTTWISTNAFTVASIANPPVLLHRWSFRDAANSTTVTDSVGNATGVISPSIGAGHNIMLDGDRALFPGDGTYADCPYISFPSGMISSMGDVTVEMWVGTSNTIAWTRAFVAGDTTKGQDPHTYPGHSTTGLQFITSYSGNYPAMQARTSGTSVTDLNSTSNWANNTEHQVVMVWAPNASVLAYYLDGALVNSTAPAALPLSTAVNDTVDWLGVSLDNNDPPLSGWINELRIYEGAYSASQVSADYSAGPSAGLPTLVSTTPTNIVTSVSGNTLMLSWPADHLGWKLQVQTNALGAGLGTNWFTIPGSDSVTSTNLTIVPTNGAVFYRLMY